MNHNNNRSSKMITKIKASSRKSAANSTFADTDKSTDEKSFTGIY